MADNFSAFLESTAPPSGNPVGGAKVGSAITPPGMKPPEMPTLKEYTKQGRDLMEEEKAARAPFIAKEEANISKMYDLAKQIKSKASPESPKLQDIKDVPDAQYKDPMQALGSMGTILAIFGSLKTRAPLTSALNSAAAAMQGFHKGDQEAVKLEREKWHDGMEKALKQNDIEMQKYTNALTAAKFDIAKARPEFEAIAAENEHNTMLVAAQHQDYAQMFKLYDGGVKIQQKLVDTYVKDQEFRLRQADIRARAAESAQAHRDSAAATAQYRKESLQLQRDKMEEKAGKDAAKVVEAGKPTERAIEIIGEMKGILETNSGVTGIAGMAKRPLESVLSVLGGPEAGPAHQYESLARELQNVLRQTSEFHYKGRTLSKEVADRDVMVRGLKFGDTGSISFDQLTHLENMLTGQGASFQSPDGRTSTGAVTATNPKTGEKLLFKDGQWQPMTP